MRRTISTVGTLTSLDAIESPMQRNNFYANGLIWQFYSNGTDLVYRTSANGISWSAEQVVRTCDDGHKFSICFDGEYLHYAYASQTGNEDVRYRRGVPEADGAITWSAEQVANDYFTQDCYYPSICVDSAGYPMIAFTAKSQGNWYPTVLRSTKTDGTWSNDWPFQIRFTGIEAFESATCIVALPNRKALIVVGINYFTMPYGYFNGSSWSAGQVYPPMTLFLMNKDSKSMVSKGENAYLVALLTTLNQIRCFQWTGSSFAAPVIVQAASSTSYPVVSLDRARDLIYCFWGHSPVVEHIYYKKRAIPAGGWDANPTDLLNEVDDKLTLDGRRLSTFYETYRNKLGLGYMTKDASPYNVRFTHFPPFPRRMIPAKRMLVPLR